MSVVWDQRVCPPGNHVARPLPGLFPADFLLSGIGEADSRCTSQAPWHSPALGDPAPGSADAPTCLSSARTPPALAFRGNTSRLLLPALPWDSPAQPPHSPRPGPSAAPRMGPSTADPEHAPSAAQATAGLPSIALTPHSPSFPRVPQQLLSLCGDMLSTPGRTLPDFFISMFYSY